MVKNFLCIIPARRGSKGIKNKNIYKLKNKPLIQYTIDCAKKLSKYTDIIVSTDCKKISKIIKKNKLPFFGLRPKDLSNDKAQTIDVVKYEVRKLENLLKKQYKIIILLQPTSPFRDVKNVIKAIKILTKSNYDSVMTISDVQSYHPLRMKIFNKKNILVNYICQKKENTLPRQSLPKVYIRSGSLYCCKRYVIDKYNGIVGSKCFGIVVKGLETVNIDTKNDIDYLSYLLKIK